MSEKLTFHIVYVPGSVRHLLPFVSSLLHWSAYHYRLVANGCSPAEIELLQAYSHTHHRLEFAQIPTTRPLAHHDALNYLQAENREAFFCFMDSDILATGPFMDIIPSCLATHVGLFAGAPLWCRPSDQVFHPEMDVICGEHDRTASGLPLGGTFFAVYNQRVLTDYIRNSGFGFELRSWSHVPATLQPWCAARGLAGPRHFFDTGKVLNLGLLQVGHSLALFESPQLCHLGGLSFIAKRNWYIEQKGIHGLRGTLYRAVRSGYIELRRRIIDDPVNRSRKLPFGTRRRRYGPYFTALLTAAIERKPLPPLPDEDDPDVRRRAKVAMEQILAISNGDVA